MFICSKINHIGGLAVAIILRVWALYSRSGFILGALLTMYAIEIIPYLIFCIRFSVQNEHIGV